MTTNELQEILTGECNLNVKQIQQFIYEMKTDVFEELYNRIGTPTEQFYQGVINAFQLCLDLLNKCKSEAEE